MINKVSKVHIPIFSFTFIIATFYHIKSFVKDLICWLSLAIVDMRYE